MRQTLGSETAQHSIAAMTPQERSPLDAYLALADPATGTLPAGLAAAANQALHGIEMLSLHTATSKWLSDREGYPAPPRN